MPEAGFQFARVPAVDGEVLWHVQQGRRFIGTLTEVGGGYEATRLVGGAAKIRRFAEREAAARWLASLAPKD